MKSPILAAMLNVVPGLGYVYVGGKRRIFGFLLIAVTILSIIATLNNSSYQQLVESSAKEATTAAISKTSSLSLIAGLVSIAAFTFDAYAAAKEFNQAYDAKIKALIK